MGHVQLSTGTTLATGNGKAVSSLLSTGLHAFDFIYTSENPNHIASVGLTICTVNVILCHSAIDSNEEKLPGPKKTLFFF